jgi:hypothetical protein
MQCEQWFASAANIAMLNKIQRVEREATLSSKARLADRARNRGRGSAHVSPVAQQDQLKQPLLHLAARFDDDGSLKKSRVQ